MSGGEGVWEAAGRQAWAAVQRSPSYAYLRGCPVEVVEQVFLPPEPPGAAVQLPGPLTERRRAFRAGWAAAAGEEDVCD